MPENRKTYFNWSSGKDASLALYHMQKEGIYSVDKLVTSINAHHNRVSMHGLRKELLDQQTKSIGLLTSTIELPEEPTMEDYNQIMTRCLESLKAEGYSDCGFGDIFLEDLRVYREEQLKPMDIQSHFPLWNRNTKEVITEFIKLGFKAIVICIKSDVLDESFIGREINDQFINDLPKNVDPCGENGEFHTFCYDGPIFEKPVNFDIGEKVFRTYENPEQDNGTKNKDTIGFWFCDLLPIKEKN